MRFGGAPPRFQIKSPLHSQRAFIWNPGSELNVSPVGCPPEAEVKRTSHPKRAMAPLQGAIAKIEDAAVGIPQKNSAIRRIFYCGNRRRPTLPDRYQSSTIGTEGLNFCVRYGNRWAPFVIATGNGELLNSNLMEPVRFRTKASQVVSIPFLRRETIGPFSRPYLPPSGPSDASRPDNRIEFRFKFLTFTN